MAQVLEQTIDPETVPAIETTLNYIKNTGEKLFTYTGGPGSLDVRTGGTVDPHQMTIRNGRRETKGFTLDRNGFHFVPHPTKVTDFFDEGEIKRVYYPEMEALVKAESGAKRVVVFDHTLRTADDELREKTKIREVVRRVHNDYTEWSGPQRVRDLLPQEADELLRGRFAIIQVWRPIRHPVETFPLGICDARSVTEKDFVISERVYPDRVGQTYATAYNPTASMVLVSAHAARRGAGVQGVRFGEGRACALDRAHGLRGPDLIAPRPPAREHRNPHPGVFLGLSRSSAADAVTSP